MPSLTSTVGSEPVHAHAHPGAHAGPNAGVLPHDRAHSHVHVQPAPADLRASWLLRSAASRVGLAVAAGLVLVGLVRWAIA